MQLIYRLAKVEDLPRIMEIETICFGNFSYPLFVFRQYFDLFPQLFLVAEIENRIVAYSVCGIKAGTNEAWFLSTAVLPDYSGFGIASNLKEMSVTKLKELNVKYVYTTVHPENEKMIAVNEKFGLEIIESNANYYGDNSPRLIMKLSL